jgi:hypothetical protein
MEEAAAFPGTVEFLKWAGRQRVSVSIISHKTQYPFLGPRYDLHRAARLWVEQHLKDGARALVMPEDVHFEPSQEEKLDRIRTTACDYYIDDLPEILLAPGFPEGTRRLLFDPETHHRDAPLKVVRSWQEILGYFEQECRPTR